MDEEEVEARGVGGGAGAVTDLLNFLAAQRGDHTTQRPNDEVFFGAWRSYFVPLYGLITLGANFAFNEQKYRLYNLLCNTRIEEETFRLPLKLNRKRQIRTV